MIVLQVFLWILFALALLLCLLLVMKFSVRLKYGEQNAVILGLGFVRINLTKLRQRREKKKKKPKIQSLAKSLAKEQAEQGVNERPKEVTKGSVKNGSATTPAEKSQEEKDGGIGQMLKDFVKGKSLTENLALLKNILVQTSERFSKYASIKVKKLKDTDSCPEAADTAVLFGIANGVVCSIVGIIESFSMFSIEKGAVGVYQDYISGKSTFEADIHFSMRVFRLIMCVFPALKAFMTKGKNPHQRSKNK